MVFTLNSVLERDTFHVSELDLCEVRLMDNKLFPWLILVPMRERVREWIDLERAEQHLLSDEIAIISHIFQALTTPCKLNIATLGNQVEQMHVHIIGRYKEDAAWPNPVWGGPREYYDVQEKEQFLYELRSGLGSFG